MSTDEAVACSGIFASPQFGVLTREVPQNGQLLAAYSCLYGVSCSGPATIDVRDGSGASVTGTLTSAATSFGTLYAFRPDQPWSPGATYQVSVDALAAMNASSSFTVVPPAPLEAGRISAAPALAELRTPLEEVCCEEARDSCGSPYCVALVYHLELTLHMHVTLPRDQLGQWLSRLHAVDVGDESTLGAVAHPVSAWGEPALRIVEQRTYYCAQLELQNLVDGTTLMREPQCVDHGSLPDLGRTDNNLLPAAQGISQCSYPRPGIEQAWCAGTAERCEYGIFEGACERYAQHCDVEDAPVAAPEDTQDSVLESASAAPAKDAGDVTCTLGIPGQRPPTRRWGPLSLALLVAIARRRR